MSIFGTIMNKIFHHGSAPAAPARAASQLRAQLATRLPSPRAPAPAAAAPQNVDVGAVLSEMASMKGGGGNYQSSIVDLLKLLDMDLSLDARKELANELNVHVGADGSAEENIALHKAVMASSQKMAASFLTVCATERILPCRDARRGRGVR